MCPEALGDGAQRRFIRGQPARVGDVVARALAQREAVMVLVHAQEHGLQISDYIDFASGAGAGTLRAAFLHCGPRHHSLAIVQVTAPKRLHHFMLQVRQLSDVGTTFDRCRDAAVPITMELGCHTNDHMVSFYAQTPSGFNVEYGHGSLEIDDDVWEVRTRRAASAWGLRPPAVRAAQSPTAA